MATKPDPTAALADACNALGDVMLEMQRRKLLARGIKNTVLRESAEARAKTDEQLAKLAEEGVRAAAVARPRTADLVAAQTALMRIMVALHRRILGPMGPASIQAVIDAEAPTDEQIGELAADAFEAAATVLAKLGAPGAAVFTCGAAASGEEPDRG